MKTFPLIAAALAVGCVSVETVAADAGTKIDPGQTNEPLRVALTFDDSLKDHLLIAAPMLEERGWSGLRGSRLMPQKMLPCPRVVLV